LTSPLLSRLGWTGITKWIAGRSTAHFFLPFLQPTRGRRGNRKIEKHTDIHHLSSTNSSYISTPPLFLSPCSRLSPTCASRPSTRRSASSVSAARAHLTSWGE
jgi:hypothetical protein